MQGVPPGIKSNAGFMCQTVEGVVIGMRAMLTDPWKMAKLDFTVHPLPWDEAEFSSQKKLTVGWYQLSQKISDTLTYVNIWVRICLGSISMDFSKPFPLAKEPCTRPSTSSKVQVTKSFIFQRRKTIYPKLFLITSNARCPTEERDLLSCWRVI